MATTIQIKESTLKKLKRLKKEKQASSYDELIQLMIENELQLPNSLFGFMKGKTTPFKRDESDHDHNW
ncbi:MAG: ribbon-helix-helix protein, CopG family [Promethearchaeota archaeon]